MKKVVSILLAAILAVFATVPAFAAVDSPEGKLEYKVIIIPTEGGTGEYSFTSEIDENAEQGVHLVPVPYDGYTFDHWELRGSYRAEEQSFPVINLGTLAIKALRAISSGDTSGYAKGEMDVVISSDLYATPYYVKSDSGEPATGTVSVDNTPTSPKTGVNDAVVYMVIAILLAVAVGASVFLIRVTKKSK